MGSHLVVLGVPPKIRPRHSETLQWDLHFLKGSTSQVVKMAHFPIVNTSSLFSLPQCISIGLELFLSFFGHPTMFAKAENPPKPNEHSDDNLDGPDRRVQCIIVRIICMLHYAKYVNMS